MIERKKLIELIPWYLNGTLTGAELEAVEYFINNDPEGRAALDEWRRVQYWMKRDADKKPPVDAEIRLFDRIRSQSFEQLGIFHPYALGLSMVILVLLWTIIRPGITLHWSTLGYHVTTFRIYRSEINSIEYQLIDELPVDSATSEYSYVDLIIWPFEDYIYYVEGMDQAGSVGSSQIVASSALVALPGQLALICGSFFSGYGIILMIRYRKLLLIGNVRNIAV